MKAIAYLAFSTAALDARQAVAAALRAQPAPAAQQQARRRPPTRNTVMARGHGFQNANSASPLRQAMRSASAGGRSASQARDQFACSTM